MVNNELEKNGMEMLWSNLRHYLVIYLERWSKTTKTIKKDTHFRRRDSNLAHPKQKSEALKLESTCLQ
jgi:hypothetical protein